jgi:hypothetical protein
VPSSRARKPLSDGRQAIVMRVCHDLLRAFTRGARSGTARRPTSRSRARPPGSIRRICGSRATIRPPQHADSWRSVRAASRVGARSSLTSACTSRRNASIRPRASRSILFSAALRPRWIRQSSARGSWTPSESRRRRPYVFPGQG